MSRAARGGTRAPRPDEWFSRGKRHARDARSCASAAQAAGSPAADVPKTTAARAEPALSRRTSSIARSIAMGAWVRRLVAFVLADALVALACALSVLGGVCAQLPDWAHAGPFPAGGASMRLESAWPNPLQAQLVASVPGQGERTFDLAAEVRVAVPGGTAILVCEVLALASGATEPRRIRRKLRPLNELALAAEAVGSAAADDAKLAQLEHAISQASVDAPSISTGDQDLRSIEVALNGLLRRMQEAKAQQMRFVSDASHELRTPIAVIQGYVGMLDRWGKSDPAVLEESIDALKSEAGHMQELVEQLLFLARGDSGRQSLVHEAFDMAELVAEVAGESQMIDTGHTYEAQRDEGPSELVADRAMVKQAMRVMVQNAARYSAPGTRVRLRALADDRARRVGFSVTDEGVGIAAADAPHVFDRFFRSDAARGGSREGSGLGLAIAKWIVDAHDGQIEVLSREGVGTRFTVWLPRG